MTDDTRVAIVGAAAAGLAVAGTLRPLCVLMQVADDQPRELDERFRTSGIGSLDAAASLATGGRRRGTRRGRLLARGRTNVRGGQGTLLRVQPLTRGS
ncbi:MAG: hypothetical protein JO181_09590 [Solirubrobacterales bacterium]|nr:hypothetical protein [Solirubrobacterales bacterium]